MGGGSKQTVGYKYLLGMHLVYCLGAVDKLLELRFSDKTAWSGDNSGGRLFISKNDLFGGEKREGGVSGYVDVEMGAPDQAQNDYLKTQLGDNVPAWRGITGLVFRQFYLGNNPYLKKPAAKLQRVFTTPDGQENWYPEKAGIGNSVAVGNTAIYLALDGSGSMAWDSPTRMSAQQAAVIQLLELFRDAGNNNNDIRVVYWGETEKASIERRNCTATGYAEIIAFVNGLPAPADGTNFTTAVTGAKAFFDGTQTMGSWDILGGSQGFPLVGDYAASTSGDIGSGAKVRKLVFVTDGIPTWTETAQAAADILAEIPFLDVYGINIEESDTQYTSLLDNTPDDGVPVVTGGDTDALLSVFQGVFSDGLDYNPAHFLRDVILYPASGTTDQAANIGDSFTSAADTLFAERFGISLKFQNPRSKRENKAEIERHIDARVFKDRLTNKWEIKLIRDDYNVNDLFVIDESNGITWSNFTWRESKALPNQVTITYSDPKENKTAAQTITNAARVQQAGRIINEAVTYEGIRNHSLAARVALRDLNTLGSSLKAGVVTVFDLPSDLNIGSPIILNNPRQGINSAVFRIVDLKEGDGRSNEIEIDVIEEVFALGDEAIVAETPLISTGVASDPLAVTNRLVEESPYFEIVKRLGQRDSDALLVDEPAIGFLNVVGEAPTGDAINAVILADAGGGYDGGEILDFSPGVAMRSSLSGRADHKIVLTDRDADIVQREIGSMASIGSEYLRLDSVGLFGDLFALDDVTGLADAFGTYALLTFGRGCLDTVPIAHATGDQLLFWHDGSGTDGQEYFDGEAVDFKLRTVSAGGLLEEVAAPIDVVTFDQRALRPYPPGNLKIDASFARQAYFAAPLAVTWAHRDRTIQTTDVYEDHTYSNIGPEIGVTYILGVDLLDEAGALVENIFSQNVGSATSHTIDFATYSTVDNFAFADKFALTDVFLVNAKFTQADVFNSWDAFGDGFPKSAQSVRVSIKSIRDGLESRNSATLEAGIFLPPINLTVMEIT